MTSPRFKWYSTLKENVQLENYLNYLDIKKFRDQLIRFRFGINDLKVNSFYTYTQDSLCPFCEETEDEIHFVLYCKPYQHLREKYLSHYLDARMRNIARLFQGKEKKTRAVAMFIHYAYKLRKQLLDEMLNIT